MTPILKDIWNVLNIHIYPTVYIDLSKVRCYNLLICFGFVCDGEGVCGDEGCSFPGHLDLK